MQISLLSPQWDSQEYSLIDSGGGYKLERFGRNVLMRPEPQALWQPTLSWGEWEELISARFHRSGSGDKGEWEINRGVAEQWWIERQMEIGGKMSLRMGMTSFKHVGVFAEQGANWDFLQSVVSRLSGEVRVLNMFAYTGGASIAAALAGAEVTHLDSVKAVNHWAKENAERSGVSNIRYIADDAMEFAARELRRENSYRVIVLDPPAYGRGTGGQKWVLEENIYEMLQRCEKLLSSEPGSTLLLSLYSMGFSALLAHTLLQQIFGDGVKIEAAELFLTDQFSKRLPLGLSLRVVRL